MKPPILIFFACGLAFTATALASGPGTPDAKHLQPSAPRTITVSEADTPPVVRAGVLQSTLILLPDQEKVANVFAGDTVDWVGHPQTNRIYAWAHDTDDPTNPKRYVTVLHIPPVVSPQTAVQAAILQEYKSRAKTN